MRPIFNIVMEIVFISISAVILLPVIEYFFTKKFLEFRKGSLEMYLGTIILVSLLHIIYEILGFNESWCKMTY